jgi:hypothetical protein
MPVGLAGTSPHGFTTLLLAGRSAEEGIDGLIAAIAKGPVFSPGRNGGGGGLTAPGRAPGNGL